MRRVQYTPILAAAAVFLLAGLVYAQDQGPIAPPPKFEVNRIPSVPHPGPPPIPEQEIIRSFATHEDEMKKAYDTYDFSESIRIEELGDPGGKLTETGEASIKPDGQRYWRVTKPFASDLTELDLRADDLHEVISLPLFFLTTQDIGNYNFLYAGQDKLDELTTYVFQVKPKQLNRRQLFFDGVIWVDDHDLAIVKTYGKFVSELTSNNSSKLPFSMFEAYRENFQEKYWLPTYINSDAFKSDANGQIHLRLVIHSTDFKLNGSPTVGASPASPDGPQTQPIPPR